MKKIILTSLTLLVSVGFIAFSCKPKNDSDALTPGWTTSSGNPSANTPGNATTTGTIATTSSAQNSSMTGIGQGSSWLSSGCSGSSCISVSNNQLNTVTEICFAGTATITSGAYTIVGSSTALIGNNVHIKVTSPTGQESGSVWFAAAGGVVNVTGGPTAPITCSFTNVSCKKSGSNFPIVTISGQVGCI